MCTIVNMSQKKIYSTWRVTQRTPCNTLSTTAISLPHTIYKPFNSGLSTYELTYSSQTGWQQFFTNSDITDCPIETCQYTQYTGTYGSGGACTQTLLVAPFSTYLTISSTTPWQGYMVANYAQSYGYVNVCYGCYQGYYPNTLFGPITIRQGWDCTIVLTPKGSQPGTYT